MYVYIDMYTYTHREDLLARCSMKVSQTKFSALDYQNYLLDQKLPSLPEEC